VPQTTSTSRVKKFTDDVVRRLRVPLDLNGTDQRDFFENLFEGRSLILTLNKSGKTSWSVLFYENGRPRRKKLDQRLGQELGQGCGEWPETTVKVARRAAREFDATKALARAAVGTFGEVADQFLDQHVRGKGLISGYEIERHVDTYLRPVWNDVPFADIRRRTMTTVMDEISRKHGPATADAVLATLRKMCRWFEGRDDDYTSPVISAMRRYDAKPRDRWLSDDEIRQVWWATEAMGVFGSMVRLLLLTGQRREKVRTMRWSDIDLETGIWTIRRRDREKGTPGQLVLPEIALEIIRAQPRVAHNPFVLAGRGSAAFAAWSQRKAALDKKLADVAPWRIHDLRRTCRALMTRCRVTTEVAERVLGHALPGIQAVYVNPAEFRDQTRDALRRVAVEVERILSPEAKVIALR
jgi:integrase